jgi:hypothetical protein
VHLPNHIIKLSIVRGRTSIKWPCSSSVQSINSKALTDSFNPLATKFTEWRVHRFCSAYFDPSIPKLMKCRFELTYLYELLTYFKTIRAQVVMFGIKLKLTMCRFELTYIYDLPTYY